MADDRVTCSKCGKTKKTSDFFLYKDNTPCDMCKDCLTMYIKNTEPETFLWILEKFDIPYIEKTWVEHYNRAYKKNPGSVGPRSVIGIYLRTMKMKQYKDLTYADSDKINFKDQQAASQAHQLTEEELEALDARLEAGEISQAEYDTLTAKPEEFLAGPQFVTDINQEHEDKIAKELSEEDFQYLMLKWGEHYRPSQWVKLEELYTKYEAEYELNADREDALKKICKVSLKIDEALDVGDTASLDKLQRTYDNLRKSAKFTEAQNKEAQTRELDSIGELVAFVEREGGAIPLYREQPTVNEDKLDFCIKDMQKYVTTLVRDELGLGDLIERYIEEAQNNKNQTVEDIMEDSFNEEDEELTAEDIEAFATFQADEIEREAELLAEIGE